MRDRHDALLRAKAYLLCQPDPGRNGPGLRRIAPPNRTRMSSSAAIRAGALQLRRGRLGKSGA